MKVDIASPAGGEQGRQLDWFSQSLQVEQSDKEWGGNTVETLEARDSCSPDYNRPHVYSYIHIRMSHW